VSALKDALDTTFKKVEGFAEKYKFTQESTPNISGFLEVSVNDTLVHSKKNGDGYVNTNDKMKKIIDAVRNGLMGQPILAPPPAAAAAQGARPAAAASSAKAQ